MKIKINKPYKFIKSEEYSDWFERETAKSQLQIMQRLSKIEDEGYFGDHRPLPYDLLELKWLNGRRIYYAFFKELNIVLLLGGNKNGQSQDIKQAKKIFQQYKDTQE